MLFQDPDFQKLLLLHSRDRRYQKLVQELEELPHELDRMDEKIAVEQKSVELALAEWKNLESQNNTLEKEILSKNELIAKQRNRQLEVKKNEEYQALENEISNLLSKIEEQENEQIEVLLKIDGARETAEVAQGKISERVAEMQEQRDKRASLGEERKVETEELKTEIEETRKDVEPSFLATYDRVKKIVSRPPYMAPINDQKCTGCHLRVSNDVVSSVLVEKKITQCDQCGRIVYVER
jgi:predicted  nucleic acid-binding Zn-ribbon protein|tara:strand:- start:444 stop:1160 length:717 start_codon:yes stop_codon:yes gene_type:complete